MEATSQPSRPSRQPSPVRAASVPDLEQKAADLEQKVLALSRRAAAELQRGDEERLELQKGHERLQQVCRQLESAFQMLTERTHVQRQDVNELQAWYKESAPQQVLGAREIVSGLQILTERVDEQRKDVNDLQARLNESVASGPQSQQVTQVCNDLQAKLEAQFEAALAGERKQAHERLKSSCSELVGHLNELRCEVVRQRDAAQELHKGPTELVQQLQSHLAELGEGLAQKMQAEAEAATAVEQRRADELQQQPMQALNEKVRQIWASVTPLKDHAGRVEGLLEKLQGQVQLYRSEGGEIHKSIAALQGQLREVSAFSGEALDVARTEASTVHCEVMSIDSRVAAIEERMSHRAERKRLADASGNGFAADVELSSCLTRSSWNTPTKPSANTLIGRTSPPTSTLGTGALGADAKPEWVLSPKEICLESHSLRHLHDGSSK